jgi:DNA-binding CsgD family transcriptional regulator
MNLPPKQRRVAELLLDGYMHKEIADKLDITIKTVEKHVERLRARLGVTGRNQLEFLRALQQVLDDSPRRRGRPVAYLKETAPGIFVATARPNGPQSFPVYR